MPSQYCRATSDLLYWSSDLTLAKMYEWYCTYCEKDRKEPLSYETYRKIFQSMNLLFHAPKMDRCETCERYRNLDLSEQLKNRMFISNIKNARKNFVKLKNKNKIASGNISIYYEYSAVLQKLLLHVTSTIHPNYCYQFTYY